MYKFSMRVKIKLKKDIKQRIIRIKFIVMMPRCQLVDIWRKNRSFSTVYERVTLLEHRNNHSQYYVINLMSERVTVLEHMNNYSQYYVINLMSFLKDQRWKLTTPWTLHWLLPVVGTDKLKTSCQASDGWNSIHFFMWIQFRPKMANFSQIWCVHWIQLGDHTPYLTRG